MSRDKVGINVRALMQRINRKLAPDQVVKSNKRSTTLSEVIGTYYVLDIKRKHIAERDVDLVRLGKKLGAMHEWEELVD